jgi:hypothetical protein
MTDGFAFWDYFPATEMQHDFYTKCGISMLKINGSTAFNNDPKLRTSMLSKQKYVLRAKTDKDLWKSIFGESITIPDGSSIVNGVRKWIRPNAAKDEQIWEIRAASIDLRGERLANELGIPNNSVAIVDTEGGIIKRLKSGPSSNFTLYYCINNVTRADSATKKNVYTAKGKGSFSSSSPGITCKGLVSKQTILVNGDNELKMNYKIKNELENGVIKQTWTSLSPETNNFVVNDANKENNITSLAPTIRRLHNGDRLAAPDEAVIQAFLRKRSGDYFQGWITKYLLKKLTNPLEVLYYHKPGRVWEQFDLPKANIQDMYTSDPRQISDIFTVTIDYPYLCYCIECLGISVLFRQQNQIIYFRRTNGERTDF